MAEVTIDPATFTKRLKKLIDHWQVGRSNVLQFGSGFKFSPAMHIQAHQSSSWANVSALAIVVGSSSEDLRYLKSISLQLWLFGYELPGPSSSHGINCMNILPPK